MPGFFALAMLTVDEARCVHRLAAVARCRACADACPTGAWTMQPDGLDFDPARCDGCGLCVPACPPGALALAAPPALPLSGDTLSLACEHAPLAAGPLTRVPCLHAISEARLLALYLAGLRRLGVVSGTCATCPRGRVMPLVERLDALNDALRAAGAPAIELLPTAMPCEAAPSRRRGFFGLLRPAARTSGPDTRPAALRLLASIGRSGGLWAVSLDVARCTGCAVCARLCPEGAIDWLEAGAEAGLRLRMERCTGCNLCVDACDQGALRPGRAAGGVVVAFFHDTTCSRCSATFRHPAGHRAPPLCPVCRTGARRPDRLVVD